MKLGGARDQSRIAWRLAVIEVAADSATFSYRLDRNKLRQARSREGRYLLRTNLVEEDPAKLWSHYLLLVAVEEASKTLKSLPLRRWGATWRSGRSFTRSRRALKPTSSSPSWPIACTSPLRGARMLWRRVDAAQRDREVRRCADDRRAPADHRWPRAGAHPLHRARTRAQPFAEETEAGSARPTTTQNHRRRSRPADPAVVPTFGGRP